MSLAEEAKAAQERLKECNKELIRDPENRRKRQTIEAEIRRLESDISAARAWLASVS